MGEACEEIRSGFTYSNMWMQETISLASASLQFFSLRVCVCMRHQMQQEKVVQLAQGKSKPAQQQGYPQPNLQGRTFWRQIFDLQEKGLNPCSAALRCSSSHLPGQCLRNDAQRTHSCYFTTGKWEQFKERNSNLSGMFFFSLLAIRVWRQKNTPTV